MKARSFALPANAAIRRSAVLLVAVALGATTWMLNTERSSADFTEAAVDPSTPVLATGTVLGGGAPLPGVTVSLLANPTRLALNRAGDVGVATLPMGEAISADDGSYRIWGSLENLPADYVGPSGQVDVELVFDNGGTGTTWNYTLYPLGTSVPGSTVPSVEGAVARVAADGSTGENTLAPVLAIDLGTRTAWAAGREVVDDGTVGEPEAMRTAGFNPITLTSVRGVKVGESDTAELTEYVSDYLDDDAGMRQGVGRVAASALASVCITRWVDDWKMNKPEKFVTTHGWRHAKVTLSQGTSDSTTHTLGIAKVSTDGTLSASGTYTKSYSTGNTVTTPGLVDHIVYNRINYRKKVNTCGLAKWWPYSAYDFNTEQVSTYNALYHNCANKAEGTTWSTSTARNTTYSGGMDIGAISLSAQAGYGNSVDLRFRFAEPGEICGNLPEGPLNSTRVSAGPR